MKWSDDDLARLVTPAAVPRAFDVSSSLDCPKCGQEIHEKFGSYPWQVDLKKPFKLTCPVEGTVYPSGYNFLRVSQLSSMAGLMDKAGYDIFALPRMRRLYDGVLDVINIRCFTPALG
ncbi:MAG: hypothetical protein JWN98_1976 [Abditibacteriota bacterium]|nr:hypothetical protein [Abditibacteriota bacterium]